MDIKVSVGIPFYNAEKFLGYAIKSVLNQTLKEFELILLDDGSTDCSLEVAKSFNDIRIKVISDGQHRGLSYRLNELLNLSKSKLCARMDADDIMHPQRLEQQVNYLINNSKVDVVGSSTYTIDINNKIIGTLKYKSNPATIEDVLRHRCFINPSIIGRKQWFLQHPYSEKYVRMEDFELWIRTIENSVFYNIDTPLMYYRTNGFPYLDKYLKSMKGERDLLRSMKKNIKNYYWELAFNYTKCVIYFICSKFNLIDVLLTKRTNTKLTEEEMFNANNMLNIAIS